MTKEVQFRRGNSAEHSTFTGANGEITINSDRNVPVVHNGTTTGGFEVAGIGATQTLTNKTILVATATSTGTASQPLQVNGGAYFNGLVGIGVTNPTITLQLPSTGNISNQGTTSLSSTVGVAFTVSQFYHSNGNASYLRIKAARNATGSDWTTASTKIVNVIDVTEQGYIEFNPLGSNYGIALGQGASEYMRILNGGNIGIGFTNPLSKFSINGVTPVSSPSPSLILPDETNPRYSVGFGCVNVSGVGQRLDFFAGDSGSNTSNLNSSHLRMSLTAAGNVGVGITNPTNRFVIGGETIQFPQSLQVLSTLHATSRRASIAIGGTLGNQSPDWQIVLDTNGNGTKDFGFYSTAQNGSLLRFDSTGNSIFANYPVLIGSATSTGTASQPLQVTGGGYFSGSVGIGITNPSQKLEVVGGEIKAGRVDTGNEGGQVSFGRATDNATGWYIDVYGNTSTPSLRFIDVSNAAIRSVIDGSGNFLIGSATSTGTATQALQVNSGAYFASNVGISSTNPTADLHIVGPGTSTAGSAPIKVSVASTFMLATPEADAIEYDNLNLYHTPNDITNGSGRTIIPGIQFVRRTSDLSINDQATPGTSVFGATTRPALLAGTIYEIDAVLYVTKVTNSGTLTLQLSLSTGNFTFATLHMPTLSSGQHIIAGTVSPVSFPATGSLTAGLSYAVHIKGLVQPASNSRLDLLAFSSTATISALTNSYLKVSCMGRGNNIGNIG